MVEVYRCYYLAWSTVGNMKCYPEAYLTGNAWKQARRALHTAQQDTEQWGPSGNALGQACRQPA